MSALVCTFIQFYSKFIYFLNTVLLCVVFCQKTVIRMIFLIVPVLFWWTIPNVWSVWNNLITTVCELIYCDWSLSYWVFITNTNIPSLKKLKGLVQRNSSHIGMFKLLKFISETSPSFCIMMNALHSICGKKTIYIHILGFNKSYPDYNFIQTSYISIL